MRVQNNNSTLVESEKTSMMGLNDSIVLASNSRQAKNLKKDPNGNGSENQGPRKSIQSIMQNIFEENQTLPIPDNVDDTILPQQLINKNNQGGRPGPLKKSNGRSIRMVNSNSKMSHNEQM